MIIGPGLNQDNQSPGSFAPGAPLAKARAFLEAPTLAEKLDHVRNPDVALPLLKEFFADRLAAGESLAMPFRRLYPSGDNLLKGVRSKGGDLHYRNFSLVLPDGSQRMLPVVKMNDKAQLAVDVPAFLRSDSDSGFRVLISEDDYYNYAYEDEEKWHAFRINNPDWTTAYFAYVERDSPIDYQLRMLLSLDEIDLESQRWNTSKPVAGTTSPDDLFAALSGKSVSAPTQWLNQQDTVLLAGSAIQPRQSRNSGRQSARPRTARVIVEIIPGYAGEHQERRQVEIVRFIQKGWVLP